MGISWICQLDSTSFYILVGLFIFIIIWKISEILFPPRNFPQNIPTVPFYVSFLGIITCMDQGEIYNTYLRDKLEKYGAVKIYFASRWNILVSRPEYLQQIFRSENVFAKSGNHIKIPYALLSEYTGENIISAHGDTWWKYRGIVTKGIQFPDTSHLSCNTLKLVHLIDRKVLENGKSIDISELLQKWSLDNIGKAMLGIDFKILEDDRYHIHRDLRYLKQQIFKPIYMNFSFLDKLPIPHRLRTRSKIREFKHSISNLVLENQNSATAAETAGKSLSESFKRGDITRKQFEDNIMIIMVAGHENPLLFITSLLYILGKNSQFQNRLHETIYEMGKNIDYKHPIIDSLLYETLRLYPPLGQIINRCTTSKVFLGSDICIPKGVYVGYNNYATGRDRNVWGKEADVFTPERWGFSKEEICLNYNRSKSICKFAAFHGRKRACLGEKFAMLEVKIALVAIISRYRISLDPNWEDKITSSGPISPLRLKVNLDIRTDKNT